MLKTRKTTETEEIIQRLADALFEKGKIPRASCSQLSVYLGRKPKTLGYLKTHGNLPWKQFFQLSKELGLDFTKLMVEESEPLKKSVDEIKSSDQQIKRTEKISNSIDVLKRLSCLLKKRGLIKSKSDCQVALYLGVPAQNYSNWKTRNRFPWEDFYKLSVRLDFDFHWLVTGEGTCELASNK